MFNGAALIGSSDRVSDRRFVAFDATNGTALAGEFSVSGEDDVKEACRLADLAFQTFSETTPEERAAFLESCAQAIIDIGDELIVRAMAETGLPRARLEGERGRTVGQLQLFAAVVRRGDWVDATIDTALPDRSPIPRPDIRRRNLAVGPVAVFGASNFPLAFSVAGGDTASALAAGCPVVVKGHPAHPGTGELVARAIQAAVKASGLPEGVFSYLPGNTHDLGTALVSDPRIKSVGFTGSRAGGLALDAVARARPEPIPVHAEMSSVNPVILLPAALSARAETLASGFVQSLTMGAGQFCTNPGLIFALNSPDLDRFTSAVASALSQAPAAAMLTSGIRDAYRSGVSALQNLPQVQTLAQGVRGDSAGSAMAAVFTVSGDLFGSSPILAHEIFGAAAVIVRCDSIAQLTAIIDGLEGQLTATLHMEPEDGELAKPLIERLQRKVGRVLSNGWPTGVEVCHAMVHGGPFPATTDGRTTSVGTLSMARFLRPVCYQNLSDSLLPPALKASNPFGLHRRVDGVWSAPTP